MNTHPKWKYHRTAPAKIVEHAEEEAALGSGWVDSPAHLEAEPEAEPKDDSKKQKKGK